MAEIMLDVDDVVMPWSEEIRNEAVDLGLVAPGATWTSWTPWIDWGIREQDWYRVLTSANRKGLYTKTAPYPDAVAAINGLIWHGHNIHVVTARAGKHIQQITPAWFADHGIGYKSMTFVQKKLTAQEILGVRFDYAIDDGPHNYVDLDQWGIDVFLMDQPHNRHMDGARRVNSLTEFANIILKEEACSSRTTA